MMKRPLAAFAWILLGANSITGLAEVKTVQMKIAGYLCGN